MLINESTVTQKQEWHNEPLLELTVKSALSSQKLPLATTGHSHFLTPNAEFGADAH